MEAVDRELGGNPVKGTPENPKAESSRRAGNREAERTGMA